MLISVVIPCFNVEPYVRECLVSVADQAYRDLEVICVDDGSSDGTAREVREATADFPFPVTLLEGANRGAAAARNRGLYEARGDYVQFLDADDLLRPTKVEHQVGLLSEVSPRPGLVVGSFVEINLQGQQRSPRRSVGDPWHDLIRGSLGSTSPNLWMREAVIAAGGWDEALRSSQEYELMFRLLQRRVPVIYDSAPLTVRRKRSGSITTTAANIARNRQQHLELRQRILEHLSETGSLDRALEDAVHQRQFYTLRSLYRYDPHAALELYRRLLPPSFRPEARGSSRLYRLSHRFLGFEQTQHIHRWLEARSTDGPERLTEEVGIDSV